MRRTLSLLALLLAAVALVAAGCGGAEDATATPETIVGEVPTTAAPSAADLPALALKGDAANGKAVFASSGCGSCHTLAAAGSNGAVGPNLDQSKPSYELVVTRVTKGQGAMPAFSDRLKAQEIADVAQYVVESTGG
jgi:mono/diheme cytochrome c family protein